jgi:hypothetical protein
MTMTPKQAYEELTELYVQATKNRSFTHQNLKDFALSYHTWAEMHIRRNNWSFHRAEDMVNRCRKLVPLALQHQP